MFEDTHRPLLLRRKFAVRMAAFLFVAVCVDGVALAVGTVGFHVLENVNWLDACLNAALVMTGNGPIDHPQTPGGKLFVVLFAILGVILFAAVIGTFLTPVFHRILHGFHSEHGDQNHLTIQPDTNAGSRH